MKDDTNERDDKPDTVELSEFLAVGKGFRRSGLIIFASSLVYLVISGDWPSGHSVLIWVVEGAAVGIILGLVLRLAIPRERRRDFIRQNYPRLGARLPPLSGRDDSE